MTLFNQFSPVPTLRVLELSDFGSRSDDADPGFNVGSGPETFIVNKINRHFKVLEKTDELLRKFNLTTVNEPKRADYKRENSPPPLKKRAPSPKKRTSSPKKRSLSPKHRRKSPSPSKRRRNSPSPTKNERRSSPDDRRRKRNVSLSPSPPRRNKRYNDLHLLPIEYMLIPLKTFISAFILMYIC